MAHSASGHPKMGGQQRLKADLSTQHFGLQDKVTPHTLKLCHQQDPCRIHHPAERGSLLSVLPLSPPPASILTLLPLPSLLRCCGQHQPQVRCQLQLSDRTLLRCFTEEANQHPGTEQRLWAAARGRDRAERGEGLLGAGESKLSSKSTPRRKLILAS